MRLASAPQSLKVSRLFANGFARISGLGLEID